MTPDRCSKPLEGRVMLEEHQLQDLIRRIRQGDPKAQGDFYLEFGPELCRIVRVNMRLKNRLRILMETQDVIDSVFMNVMTAIKTAKEHRLQSVEQMSALLRAVIGNHITDKYREIFGRCRYLTWLQGFIPILLSDNPDINIADKDSLKTTKHLKKLQLQLTEEECMIFRERLKGRSWEEVTSAQNGHTGANVVRETLERGLNRACTDEYDKSGRRSRNTTVSPLVPGEILGREPSPGSELEAKDFIDWFLRQLTETERQMMSLRLKGLTFSQVGKQVGNISADGVRNALNRAVIRVKEQLGRQGFDEVNNE